MCFFTTHFHLYPAKKNKVTRLQLDSYNAEDDKALEIGELKAQISQLSVAVANITSLMEIVLGGKTIPTEQLSLSSTKSSSSPDFPIGR
jgi:hypothetical protein